MNTLTRSRGFTLIEAIAALGVLSSVVVGAAMISAEMTEDAKIANAATHMASVGAAANYYVRDHRSQIETIATATRPFRIDVAALVTDGFLSSGATTRNALGQDVCALVFQPVPGVFNVLTVGDGPALDDASLGHLAALIGASGGGVYTKDPVRILGVGGTWQLPAATYHDKTNTDLVLGGSKRCDGSAGRIPIQQGTPVIANWFAKDVLAQYLSRYDTGDPDDTTMHTRLNMGGHALANLQVVPEVSGLGLPCLPSELNKPGFGVNASYLCMASGPGQVWVAASDCGPGMAVGDLGALQNGELLTCQRQGAASLWKRTGNTWREPVASWGALMMLPCDGASQGQTRVVLNAADGANRPRAYTCYGAAWSPLALDDNGNLRVPGSLQVGNTPVGGAPSPTATGTLATGMLEIKRTVTEGSACTTPASVAAAADGTLLSCQGGQWGPSSTAPRSYRYVFTSSQDWVVPDGVKSAFVTMAGGGSSGSGWRIGNSTHAGNSGGFLFSHPINFLAGETIRITVGKGGAGVGPVDSGLRTADALIVYGPPPNPPLDGLLGYPGTSSKVQSITRGIDLLECAGGSPPVSGHYYAGPPNDIPGPQASTYSGHSFGPWSGTRPASGPYATPDAPGNCGPGPAGYGSGVSGVVSWQVASGTYAGGRTPFNYGSGGTVYRSGCYITTEIIGKCAWAQPGEPGVVILDVTY